MFTRKVFLMLVSMNGPDMLFHIIGGDQGSTNFTDFLPLPFLVSPLVYEVDVFQVCLLLIKQLFTLGKPTYVDPLVGFVL